MKRKSAAFDAAVIGGGLGGLTAAAALAARGYRVFVAEKNPEPGGNAGVIERGGFAFERALHQLYGLGTPGTPGARLLEEIGVAGRVDFVRVPVFMEVVFPGLRFTFPADTEELEAALCRRWPAERAAIVRMLEQGRSLYQADRLLKFTNWKDRLKELRDPAELRYAMNCAAMLRYRRTTFSDYCREHFRDPGLVAALGSPWIYLGVPPGRVSAMLMVAMLGAYTVEKTYYVRGGSRRLSEALAAAVAARGGEVRLNAPVTRLDCAGGAASGLRLADGTAVEARCVISNAAPLHVFGGLLARRDAPGAYVKKLAALKTSMCAVHVLAGAELDPRRLPGSPEYETSVFGSLDHDENYAASLRGEPGSFGVCIHSLADASLAPKGCSSLAVVGLAPRRSPAWWRKNRAAYAGKLLAGAEKVLPGLRKKLRETVIVDPCDLEARTNVTGGAMYGWDNTIDQTLFDRLPPETAVKGLFLAGQWTLPGSGMTMAVHSGNKAAQLAASFLGAPAGR